MSGSRHQRDGADAIEERRGLEVEKTRCIGAVDAARLGRWRGPRIECERICI
jgi:hypothetical protein